MAIAVTTRKKTPHVKKRLGQHHRKSKGYSKAYWPYLPMVIVVGMGFLVNSLWSNGGHVLGASSVFTPSSLLSDTNMQRENDHENSLTLNQQLMTAAQNKANDMAAHDYFSHDTPTGQTPWSFITATGYNYQAAGENLAYGFSSSSSVLSGWMNSPDHRANILDVNYQNVGFGIASSPNYQNKGPEVIIVALYAEPVVDAANITFSVNQPKLTNPLLTTTGDPSTKLVSRVQLLSGGAGEWSVVFISALCGAALALFIIRNGLRLHKLLIKGETAINSHPYIDLVIVSIVTAGVLLTRTSGFIR
jgi:hypothetical protein